MSDNLERLEARLDKIDQKLDKLTEALVGIKVLEQQIRQHSESLARAFKRIDTHEEAIDKMKLQLTTTGTKIDISERFVWIVVSAGIGVAAYLFKT